MKLMVKVTPISIQNFESMRTRAYMKKGVLQGGYLGCFE
jgi:hypothetical protein